jgi:hypothetical protein
MGPQGILGRRKDLRAIAPPLIAWLLQQVRHELISDPVGFGAARRTPPTEPGESKPGESGVSRQPAKKRQLHNRVTNTDNTKRARPRQLIVIASGSYFINAPKNLQKQTLFNDRKGIATFSALNLSIFTVILCLHIVNKLLGEGGGSETVVIKPRGSNSHAFPARLAPDCRACHR